MPGWPSLKTGVCAWRISLKARTTGTSPKRRCRDHRAFLLAKVGAASNTVNIAGAADTPIGVITDEAGRVGDIVNVALFGSARSTLRMVASGAIAQGALLEPAASGRVQTLGVECRDASRRWSRARRRGQRRRCDRSGSALLPAGDLNQIINHRGTENTEAKREEGKPMKPCFVFLRDSVSLWFKQTLPNVWSFITPGASGSTKSKGGERKGTT
jgi:hypothetical protein